MPFLSNSFFNPRRFLSSTKISTIHSLEINAGRISHNRDSTPPSDKPLVICRILITIFLEHRQIKSIIDIIPSYLIRILTLL